MELAASLAAALEELGFGDSATALRRESGASGQESDRPGRAAKRPHGDAAGAEGDGQGLRPPSPGSFAALASARAALHAGDWEAVAAATHGDDPPLTAPPGAPLAAVRALLARELTLSLSDAADGPALEPSRMRSVCECWEAASSAARGEWEGRRRRASPPQEGRTPPSSSSSSSSSSSCSASSAVVPAAAAAGAAAATSGALAVAAAGAAGNWLPAAPSGAPPAVAASLGRSTCVRGGVAWTSLATLSAEPTPAALARGNASLPPPDEPTLATGRRGSQNRPQPSAWAQRAHEALAGLGWSPGVAALHEGGAALADAISAERRACVVALVGGGRPIARGDCASTKPRRRAVVEALGRIGASLAVRPGAGPGVGRVAVGQAADAVAQAAAASIVRPAPAGARAGAGRAWQRAEQRPGAGAGRAARAVWARPAATAGEDAVDEVWAAVAGPQRGGHSADAWVLAGTASGDLVAWEVPLATAASAAAGSDGSRAGPGGDPSAVRGHSGAVCSLDLADTVALPAPPKGGTGAPLLLLSGGVDGHVRLWAVSRRGEAGASAADTTPHSSGAAHSSAAAEQSRPDSTSPGEPASEGPQAATAAAAAEGAPSGEARPLLTCLDDVRASRTVSAVVAVRWLPGCRAAVWADAGGTVTTAALAAGAAGSSSGLASVRLVPLQAWHVGPLEALSVGPRLAASAACLARLGAADGDPAAALALYEWLRSRPSSSDIVATAAAGRVVSVVELGPLAVWSARMALQAAGAAAASQGAALPDDWALEAVASLADARCPDLVRSSDLSADASRPVGRASIVEATPLPVVAADAAPAETVVLVSPQGADPSAVGLWGGPNAGALVPAPDPPDSSLRQQERSVAPSCVAWDAGDVLVACASESGEAVAWRVPGHDGFAAASAAVPVRPAASDGWRHWGPVTTVRWTQSGALGPLLVTAGDDGHVAVWAWQ